jgi:lauroyl/myristoyl acyltransferase
MCKKPYDISRFFQTAPIVTLVKVFPIQVSRICLYVLGFLYFIFKFKDRKKITSHIKKTINNFSYYKTFLGIFDHYFEKLIFAHKPLPEMIDFLQKRLSIINKKHLDNIIKLDKGCIFVTGHFGAVEFLPLTLAMNNYKVALICKFKTKKLKEELTKRAKQYDFVLIDAALPNVVFEALKAIKNKRILITECDEFSAWRPCPTKEQVLVFGNTMPRDRTLDILYYKTKAPVVLGLMKREKNKFILHIINITNSVSIAEKAWATIEKYILKYPYQWYQWGKL